MGEDITTDNEENINRKDAKNERKPTSPSIIKALFNNRKYNWPYRYSEPKPKHRTFY